MLLQTMRSLRGGFGIDPMTGNPTFGLQLGDIASANYTLEEIFNVWNKLTDHASLPLMSSNR